jgi:hypothetical protein
MSGYANSSQTVVIPARANAPNTLYLGWYAKHPADTVQYAVDATAYLQYMGRTIIGTPTVTANSSDITISSISAGGGITNFLVSGGTDATSYGITWSAPLDNGTSITRVIWLPILSLFPNTTTPTIIAKGDFGPAGPAGPSGLLSATPISEGSPEGGFWLLRNGTVVMAPIADLEYPTDANLCMTLAGSFGTF